MNSRTIQFVTRNKKPIPVSAKNEMGFKLHFPNLDKRSIIMPIQEGTCGSDNTTSPPNNPPPSGGDIERIINSRISQRRKILRILKSIGHISSEQMRDMGFYSGPKRISELKDLGHKIEKTQDWKRNGIATYWYKGHNGDTNG